MTDLLSDLSTLTGIPRLTLDKLTKSKILCISHTAHETQCEGKDTVEIDIGLGVLYIKYDTEVVKYKFIPSKALENQIRHTIDSKTSPLIIKAEHQLADRIKSTYKELV